MFRFFNIILFISIMFGQFDWQDNGIPVRQGNHIEWLRTGDVGENSEMIFAWSDTREGGRDIYAKKIDQNGNELWDAEGLIIVSAPGRQEDPILVSDGDGGAYVMWKDYRDEPDDGDFYAQHVLSDGTLAWDETGVPLTTVPGKQVSPNMSGDGAGGAFAIWNDQSSGTGTFGHVYGTYLGPEQSSVLNPGVGIPLNTSNNEHSGVSIEIAAPGSAIMVWSDNRNNDEYGNDIYGQRIDTSCTTLWSSHEDGGIPIYVGLGEQGHVKVTYYSETASVIVWDDNRNDEFTEDIYAQFVDMNGNLLFDASGIEVSTASSRQYKPRIKADSQGAFVIWSDTRYNDQTPALNDIFMQKLTLEDGLSWGNEIEVCSEQTGDQTQARLSVDGNGGAFVTWMDDRNLENFDDIFIQHINSNGNNSYTQDGISVSTSQGLQMNPLVRIDGGEGAFVVWGDYRSGSLSIYTQHLLTNGNSSFEEEGQLYVEGLGGNTISGDSYKPRALYLGENETLLYWVDQRFGVFGQYNFGQKIYSGWEENVINGTKLSENDKADFPIAENLNENIMVGFPDTEGSIEGPGVKYQLLNSNLDLLGNADGTLVSQTGDPQSINKFDLVYANNHIYFAYSEQEGFSVYNIFMQKYDEFGNTVFASPISVVSDLISDNNVKAINEIPGVGVMIVYDSESWMGSSVNAIGLDYDGNVLNGWEDGISICDNSSGQQFKGVVKTSNGFYVIWKDYRGDGNDIYAQLIDFEGNLVGDSNGIPIAVENNDQGNPSITYNEIADEVFVCWEDYRSGIYYDIYCRGIDGSTLVTGDEIHIGNLSFNQKNPFVHSTLDGSYLITWQDSRGDSGATLAPDEDIYIQLLTNNQIGYDENGIIICDEAFSQVYPQIELYDESNNSYLIYWNDKRSSGKEDLINIYVQSLTVQPTECLIMDVNNDGIINVIDIVGLVNIIFDDGTPSEQESCAADVNGDGTINVIDVVVVVNYILSF